MSSTYKTIVAPPPAYIETKVPSYITICDPSVPHVEHPNSCYKFLHCQPTKDGSYVYAIKTCYPDMMYNPVAMVCDWPASVKAMKPQCGVNPGEVQIETWEMTETIITKTRTSKSPATTQRPIVSPPGYNVVIAPYYIQICDPSVPMIEHPDSCYKFLQCQQSANGSFIYVEKNCGDALMFNPTNMVCDWPASVTKVKPICDVIFDYEDKMVVPVKIVSTPKPSYVVTTGASHTLNLITCLTLL